ncbi:MAG: CHASE3 domain-containing protein [Pseudomonadota bacterium]
MTATGTTRPGRRAAPPSDDPVQPRDAWIDSDLPTSTEPVGLDDPHTGGGEPHPWLGLRQASARAWDALRRWMGGSPMLGAFVCAVVSLLVLGVSEVGYRQLKDGFANYEASHREENDLRLLMSMMIDAEAGQRGYLYTGDEHYLRSYEEAVARVPGMLTKLRDRYLQDPKALALITAISRATHAKLTEMDITIRLRRDGLLDATRAVVASNLGMAKMETIRVAVRDLSIMQADARRVQRDSWMRLVLWVRLGVAVTAALSLVTFFFYASHYGRLAQRKAAQARYMATQRQQLEGEVQRRTAELTDLAVHLQRAREDERASLARELHDELGALLTTAKMDLTALRMELRNSAPQALPRIAQLTETLHEVITLKRRIIEDLSPSMLKHLGLVPTLQQLADDFAERSGLEVITRLDDRVAPDPQTSIALYRTVQEALTNVEKYAQARRVHIELEARPADTLLRIRDDGIGFDAAQAIRAGAHGLVGMRHRATALRGELHVHSRPGRGTLIEVIMPWVPEPAAGSEAAPAPHPAGVAPAATARAARAALGEAPPVPSLPARR